MFFSCDFAAWRESVLKFPKFPRWGFGLCIPAFAGMTVVDTCSKQKRNELLAGDEDQGAFGGIWFCPTEKFPHHPGDVAFTKQQKAQGAAHW